MRKRMGVLLLTLLAASTAMAWDEGCAPEYTEEQCAQAQQDGPPGSNNNGGTCPYYMCGNAFPRVQSAVAWCDATGVETDCPIEYCEYRACIGQNCYPTSEVCSTCASRAGNRAHMSECPRT